jgi:hypothetical protein
VEVAASPQTGILVPSDAILDSGARTVVFVAQGGGGFVPRDVIIGRSAGGNAIVVDGLHENDEVVSRAAFFIDSESNLAAALANYDDLPSTSSMSIEDPVGVAVTVRTSPDPPRTGDNQIEVRVVDAERRPVADAEVQVLLSMPPMPAMDTPAMRSKVHLNPSEAGVYRGSSTISMTGRWDVSVNVLLRGRPIATSHTMLLVR